MKIQPFSKAFLFALTVFAAGPVLSGAGNEAVPAKPAAAGPLIWKLEGTTKIGGLTPEVLGSPKIIEEGGGKALFFNGRSDGLVFTVNPLAGCSRFTVEALIKPDPTGEEEQRFIHIQDSQGHRAMLETRVTPDSQWVLDTYLRVTAENGKTLIDRARKHPSGQWYWVALVYDGAVMSNYINGVKELDGEVRLPPMVGGAISIGVRQNKVSWYKGAIREVRFHREALVPAALQRVETK